MSAELDRFTRTQAGLVTRAQAVSCGIARSALRHRLASGRWQTIVPGVFAVFPGPPTDEQRLVAATLYAGPASIISGAAACRVAGLRYVPDTDVVAVVLPAVVRRRDSGFVRVFRTGRMPTSIRLPASPRPSGTRSLEVPVAPTVRAVLDLAREIGMDTAAVVPRRANGQAILRHPGARLVYTRALQDVRALICESVQRGKAHITELTDELEAGPQQGSGLARLALADVAAGCLSAPECELRDLIVGCDELPEPRWNLPLPGYPGIVPDGCWPDARLVLEVDSIEWHRFGTAPERTEQRRALLASLGWTVYPVSPRRLRAEPLVVLAEIVAAYRAATRDA